MVELTPIAAELAEKLAVSQGKPIEAVIQDALEQSALRHGFVNGEPVARRKPSKERLMALAAEIAALPLLDTRTSQQIIDDIMPL